MGFSRRLEEVRTPPGLKELVTEFATEDISEERVLLFLRRRMCQSLEVHTMIEERNSSCVFAILAADLILSGENTKAVYMMFYYALVNELVLREPTRLREILDTSSTLEQVCAHCTYMNFVVGTQSRSEWVDYMVDFLTSILSSQTMEVLGLANVLRALQEEKVQGQEEVLLHSLKQPAKPLSEIIKTTMANADDGGKSNPACSHYSDATLGWWLKINTNHLPNHKYFRVVHKGRSLFLSSSGKKTLKNLGIEDGDELVIGGVCSPDNTSSDVHKEALKSKPAAKKRHKKRKGATKKNRKSLQTSTYALSGK